MKGDLYYDRAYRQAVKLLRTYEEWEIGATIAVVETKQGESYEVVMSALSSLSLLEVLAFESE